MVAAFDFSAPESALIFDQAALTTMTFTYTDSSGNIVPLALYGARMALFVDEVTVLLELSTLNGKIVVGNVAPNLVATILATDTAFGTPINGQVSGRWYLYLDPNGIEDSESRKLVGGPYYMKPLGPET